MKKRGAIIVTLVLTLLTAGCQKWDLAKISEPGVSRELADLRKATITNLNYDLRFNIPANSDEDIRSEITISFDFKKAGKAPFVLDFKENVDKIHNIELNQESCDYLFENEHIIIPSNLICEGNNLIHISFSAGKQSLNRRDNLMYTLLVPDRARTLFPCFDQPDLKASYILTLSVPNSWIAVANSPLNKSVTNADNQTVTHIFKPTEPLSTYLFSFVAGEFEKAEKSDSSGRTIGLYHRETDPYKLAQIDEILDAVFYSLEWLEEYTAIPYPFAKYDCIVLPGFQYGGMEHTGATLYNDRRIFMEKGASISALMNRFSLIAHETAHMWFGDYVTMKWFDDVWTKEVFANYFAALITSEKYPDVDNSFAFLDYASASYSVDRTEGANAIKQPLANLKDAGLIYGNIIYNKAPIVMEMLARKMDPESFQNGIRQYLTEYAYGNADWEGLVAILDKYTDEDLATWSHDWVHKPGMPHYKVDSLAKLDLNGLNYGFYELTEEVAVTLMRNVVEKPLTPSEKASALIILYENYLNERISGSNYISFLLDCLESLSKEDSSQNTLVFQRAISQLRSILWKENDLQETGWEGRLTGLISQSQSESCRRSAFSALLNAPHSESTTEMFLAAFMKPEHFTSFHLTNADLTQLCQQLAVRKEEIAAQLIEKQRERLSHPDLIAQFDYIAPALASSQEARQECFQSLLKAENREVEPWTLTVLRLLNHPLREQEALSYIRPALEIIEEIQLTGDIFFPTNWCSALLGGHHSEEAKREVELFLEQYSKTLNPLLVQKIQQAAYYI
ncbi:MAG: aminopeptidase [Bacteroidales bacterium]|nr:aminopeptidase [Bacteroidales bacterium]